jgi:hypothetical protein
MFDVLKNGSEVKLQSNALSVLEHPTRNEVDDNNDFDTSGDSNIDEHDFYKAASSIKLASQGFDQPDSDIMLK